MTNRLDEFEGLLAGSRDEAPYVLRLYVVGMTPRSIRAIANLKAICAEYLAGRHEFEVIDLHQQPHLARGEDIIAVPTLIKKSPLPPARLVGDLSDVARVLAGLGLAPRPGTLP